MSSLVPFSSLIQLKSYQPGFCEAALTDPDNVIVAWLRPASTHVNHTTVDLYVVRLLQKTEVMLYVYLIIQIFENIEVLGLVVQRITKLTVRIILRILSHGSDHFSDQQKKVV